MPVSSSTRMAASWIAATPSGGSGSVGRSGFSGMRQGIWRMACGRLPGGMAGVAAAAALSCAPTWLFVLPLRNHA